MENKYLNFKCEFKEIKDDGTFSGYASIFDSEPDSYDDIVMKGAFHKTIMHNGRNKNGIAMLYQHDAHRPIGIWTMLKEDDIGLYVEGKLAINTTDGKDAHELMKFGALKGLSIGYDAKVAEYNQETGIRTLKEIELWEISPVTFPAKITATITSVKAIEDATNERELENALRESGLSKSAAQFVVKLCKPTLLRESTEEADRLLQIIKDAKNRYFS